ncbi:MAG: PadR family transcriptional regulator [Erythrobacter sp.]
MTWNGKGGWNGLGPMIAMMAAQAASEWDESPKARRSRDWGPDSDGDDADPGTQRGWQGGRGRKRRGRMFATGELRLALLALIADEPRHGYELIKAIEDMTGGGYAPSPGAVYPTLQLLEDEGQIKPAKAKGAASEAGGKKPFRATKSGLAELEDRAVEVDALMGRLGEHGERAEKVREKSPDLFRAMGNLANVLKNRAKSGKLDKDTVDQIVDIIDEVAKRIERL